MTARLATPRAAARWAGLGYVAIFFLAIFANFLALGSVLDPGDATATASALVEHETAFRWGAVAFLAIFLIDVVVAWALYALFRDVHRDLALVSAWFRLTYTVLLGVALVFLYLALELVGSASDDSVLLALRSFDFLWIVGLAAFGVHLVLVGRLVLMTDRAPRPIAWLLVVAGAAYVVDTVAHVVLSDYERYADAFLALVAVPSVIGEMSLAVWLLLVAAGRCPWGPGERSGQDRSTSLPVDVH
ncbi:MAG: DUF4386 domain-containing protein [Nocardioides sp.]